ncbi:MAG: glutathione S-transferase C-terminal domain-containing protein [Oleiphilaceae bacterium]|nr:glutathione S-transferase C-terminal domain-containing protein [Oleiphilaceae bacterium]
MIDLYAWKTPESFKASIMLEELDMNYCVNPVDITHGEQNIPDFRALSPNGEIPVIVDNQSDVDRVFEPGAILIYLAEKAGKLLPPDPIPHYEALAWTFFEASYLKPMTDQMEHFEQETEDSSPKLIERYRDEVLRLLEVLNGRLGFHPYLAGMDYSIADIANYPRTRFAVTALEKAGHQDAIAAMKPLLSWLERVESRPAVQRGINVPTEDTMADVSEEFES